MLPGQIAGGTWDGAPRRSFDELVTICIGTPAATMPLRESPGSGFRRPAANVFTRSLHKRLPAFPGAEIVSHAAVILFRRRQRLADSHPAHGIGRQRFLLILVRLLEQQVGIDERDDLSLNPACELS